MALSSARQRCRVQGNGASRYQSWRAPPKILGRGSACFISISPRRKHYAGAAPAAAACRRHARPRRVRPLLQALGRVGAHTVRHGQQPEDEHRQHEPQRCAQPRGTRSAQRPRVRDQRLDKHDQVRQLGDGYRPPRNLKEALGDVDADEIRQLICIDLIPVAVDLDQLAVLFRLPN